MLPSIFSFKPRPLEGYFSDTFKDLEAIFDSTKSISFPIDLIEHEDYYELRADLPGVSKEEIDLQVRDSRITLLVKKNPNIQEMPHNGTYLIQERTWDKVERVISLPKEVNATDVEAVHSNGVLVVKLGKKASGISVNKITIK